MVEQRKSEFVKWMGPVLDTLRNLGGSGTPYEVSETIADDLKIPNSKREELTSSGMKKFHNQVCCGTSISCLGRLYRKARNEVLGRLVQLRTAKHLTEAESRIVFLKWVEVF